MLPLSKTVSIDQLIDLAASLSCEPGESNPEYDRALVNLVSDAAGLPADEQSVIKDVIRDRNRQLFGHQPESAPAASSEKPSVLIKRPWEEFRMSGLLWWINRQLHLFGWCIACEMGDKDQAVDAYPATCSFRGFDRDTEVRGFQALTEYLSRVSPELELAVNKATADNLATSRLAKKSDVKSAFVRAEIDGLDCYAVMRDGAVLGYVRQNDRDVWGATCSEGQAFIYDFDTRTHAAQSLGAM